MSYLEEVAAVEAVKEMRLALPLLSDTLGWPSERAAVVVFLVVFTSLKLPEVICISGVNKLQKSCSLYCLRRATTLLRCILYLAKS